MHKIFWIGFVMFSVLNPHVMHSQMLKTTRRLREMWVSLGSTRATFYLTVTNSRDDRCGVHNLPHGQATVTQRVIIRKYKPINQCGADQMHIARMIANELWEACHYVEETWPFAESRFVKCQFSLCWKARSTHPSTSGKWRVKRLKSTYIGHCTAKYLTSMSTPTSRKILVFTRL